MEWIGAAQRRLRRRRGGGSLRASKRELLALWLQQGKRCAVTGMQVDQPQLDHKVPLSKGGTHSVGNLQWVHPRLNQAKGSDTDEAVRTWLLAAADALRQKMKLEELL